MSKEKTFKTSIGGQALIEGIMMRGPEKQAIVCRLNDGSLHTKVEDVAKKKSLLRKTPFVRGIFGFIDSLVTGMSATMYSAELAVPEDDPEYQPTKVDKWFDKHFSEEKLTNISMTIGLVLGVAVSVALFMLLPALIFELFPDTLSLVARCCLEGVIRIAIFIAYLFLSTRMKEIRRVFAYHGAEHKTIFCYEKGLDLTIENVRKQSRLHPRCGTSFLFVVMFISIFMTSFMTWLLTLFPIVETWPAIAASLVRVCAKLLMLPLIVGVTYEINRWVGRHDNLFSRMVSWPGRQLQRLTTFEPDDSMMEVAIEALKLVIPEEKGTDAW